MVEFVQSGLSLVFSHKSRQIFRVVLIDSKLLESALNLAYPAGCLLDILVLIAEQAERR